MKELPVIVMLTGIQNQMPIIVQQLYIQNQMPIITAVQNYSITKDVPNTGTAVVL